MKGPAVVFERQRKRGGGDRCYSNPAWATEAAMPTERSRVRGAVPKAMMKKKKTFGSGSKLEEGKRQQRTWI